MVNINKLKGKIIENGMTIPSVAYELGIDRSTLYRKLNKKGEKLTVKEANEIVKLLSLTTEDAMAIFFDSHVA